MEIDYCILLVAERERSLLPLVVNSFRHHNPDLKVNFKASLRLKDTESAELCCRLDVEAIHLPVYKQHTKNHVNQGGFDSANRMADLMERCTADWVFLSHVDIVHKRPLSGRIRSADTDVVGMFGSWPLGLLILNRRVYNECHFGFWHLPPLWVMEHGQGNLVVRGFFDDNHERMIVGVDVGVFIGLEIQGYGYKCLLVRSIDTMFYHIGEQSGHCLAVMDDDAKEQRRLKIEEENRVALERFKHFA